MKINLKKQYIYFLDAVLCVYFTYTNHYQQHNLHFYPRILYKKEINTAGSAMLKQTQQVVDNLLDSIEALTLNIGMNTKNTELDVSGRCRLKCKFI